MKNWKYLHNSVCRDEGAKPEKRERSGNRRRTARLLRTLCGASTFWPWSWSSSSSGGNATGKPWGLGQSWFTHWSVLNLGDISIFKSAILNFDVTNNSLVSWSSPFSHLFTCSFKLDKLVTMFNLKLNWLFSYRLIFILCESLEVDKTNNLSICTALKFVWLENIYIYIYIYIF